MNEFEFYFRLKKDMTNNGGNCIKKGTVVKVTNIYCEAPFNNPRCHIENDGVFIYTTLKDLFK